MATWRSSAGAVCSLPLLCPGPVSTKGHARMTRQWLGSRTTWPATCTLYPGVLSCAIIMQSPSPHPPLTIQIPGPALVQWHTNTASSWSGPQPCSLLALGTLGNYQREKCLKLSELRKMSVQHISPWHWTLWPMIGNVVMAAGIHLAWNIHSPTRHRRQLSA